MFHRVHVTFSTCIDNKKLQQKGGNHVFGKESIHGGGYRGCRSS